MIAALMLFGLRLAPLYDALAKVESDRGATSANVYQIRNVCVSDVNRIYTACNYRSRDRLDRDKSEMIMFLYWKYWGYQYARNTRRIVTYEVLARIHNGGPDGWRKRSTLKYWKRVERELIRKGVIRAEEKASVR